MKFSTLLVIILFFSTFQVQQVYSQKTELKHTFKIGGRKRIPVYQGLASEMAVEFDTASVDHLYILEYRKNGFLKTKSRLLFKGEKFNLDNLAEFADKGELLVDGIQTDCREDETIASELLYKEGKLQQKTIYYPNGKKQMQVSGNEQKMNGEYKMWYPSGQLSFSGNYRLNVKTGEFQQFDEAGVLIKKGNYLGGKLISGEAVVQDITFESPDQPAKFVGGDKAFNDYLMKKTSELKIVKDMVEGDGNWLSLRMPISKTGKIEKIDLNSRSNPADIEILDVAFGDFPGFNPATVEDIPVSSFLILELMYSNKGLYLYKESDLPNFSEKNDSLIGDVYTVVEEMPEFPGGDAGLHDFLIRNIRYPVQALQKGMQGRVFVRFVTEGNGSISNVKVVQGVDPSIDAEAIRLVKSMPKWNPGRQNGKPVRVAFTVPITFRLKLIDN